MRKKLAIKGHPTRGEEVIELLEMMGGVNADLHKGNFPDEWKSSYYIYGDNTIQFARDDFLLKLNFVIFTLEEFLEKYPFKVGDKVVYTKFGDNCDDYPVTIESMKWTGTTIEYTFNDCVTCLAKDLKMWNGEPDAVISGIYLNSCDYADEVELNLGDYEIEVRDGRTYAVKKKLKYPKTYEECFNVYTTHSTLCLLANKTDVLYNLLICRNAYWKIADEQMGLGKPWEPDWDNGLQKKYAIYPNLTDYVLGSKNKIYVGNTRILVFPTEEMRDAFYENFKDLIERCKELL